MNPRLFFWTFGLVAVLAASSCAPTQTAPPVHQTIESVPTSTAAPADTPFALETTIASPTQPMEVQPVATSRGPNLEATDPTTVSLASGQLQLVEFFRFT